MMTTAERSDAGADRHVEGRPSIHVVRARRLLRGGLTGGLIATAASLVGCGIAFGSDGVMTAAVAAVIVLGFYVIGQLAMVLSADAGARQLMAISMTSYAARVLAIGLLLTLFEARADAWPMLVPIAFFATTIAVVVGWLAVEIYVFSRLRIGSYDTEYVAPEQAEGTQ